MLRPRIQGLLPDRVDRSGQVTPLELFFDLVYVLAVTQLTHHLLGHLSPRGALETLVLLLLVWRAWVQIAFSTNFFDLGTRSARLALLGAMLVSLVMSASIPAAFADRGLTFALAFVAIQVGWSLFMRAAIGPDHHLRPVISRVLWWEVATGAPMLAGALTRGDARLAIWLLAVALIYLALGFGFPVPGRGRNRTTDYTIVGEHWAHRCYLFVILALGESILIAGANFGTLPGEVARTVAFVVAFVGSAALWWLYFDRAEPAGRRVIASADDPGALGRSAYAFAHIPMVAGVVTVAAGDELAIAHPAAAGSPATTAVVLGGPLLFLLGNALFASLFSGGLPRSRPVAVAALIALAPAGTGVPVASLTLAATSVLVTVAVWDARAERAALNSATAGRRDGSSLRGSMQRLADGLAKRAVGRPRIGGGEGQG